MKLLTILFVFTLGLFAVSGAKAQTTGLRDFNFTPDSIDTRNGAQTITFTALVAPANGVPGGISGVRIDLYPVQSDVVYVYRLVKISSSESGELYQVVITFQEHNYSYTYKVLNIAITDNFGRVTQFNESQIAALGFKTSFQVTGRLEPPSKRRKRVKMF